MRINWKVRIKNKNFWLAIIPAILLLAQTIARALGYEIDVTETTNNLLQIVEMLFVVLTLLGIVNDPTTQGLSDSTQALRYEQPKES